MVTEPVGCALRLDGMAFLVCGNAMLRLPIDSGLERSNNTRFGTFQ
jgi:hypothetical protein